MSRKIIQKSMVLSMALMAALLWPPVAMTDVAKNDSGTPNVSSGGTTNIDLTTFTVSAGSNLCLIGILIIDGSPTGTSMEWDSAGTPQAMTSRASGSQAGAHVEIFSLVAPTPGNLTLSASWTGSSAVSMQAIAFSGADQTTCVNVGDEETFTGGGGVSEFTLTVTTSSTGATVAGYRSSGANLTATAGTEIAQDFDYLGASYTIGGSGTNAHTWTHDGNVGTNSAAGVHVIAVSAAATTKKGTMTLLGVGQ